MAKKLKPASEMSFAEILEAKKPAVQTVSICLDPALTEAREEARAKLGKAELMLGRAPDDESRQQLVEEARAAHEAAVEAVEAAMVEFKFKALGRKVLEVLMKSHPPTRDQIAEFQAGLKKEGLPPETLSYDPDRFPAELIARSCVSPKMTPEEAQAMWDSDNFSRGDVGTLFQTAWSVNQIISR